MAIELPRASPASVGSGGRVRGRRIPDAGDVPTVGIARDPGLNVRDVGRAATEGVIELAAGFQAAEERINRRRESVERMRAGREFNDFGNELFTEFSSARDFSRTEDAEEFGTMLDKRAQEIIESHDGSDESKLRLQARLEPIIQMYADRAAVASVKAQDALVQREFDEIINGLQARVRQGEDPRVLIEDGKAFLEAEKDALRPGQEVAFMRSLNARVWGAKVDSFMARGAIDEAESLLRLPEVAAAIGDEGQTAAFNRIDAARRAKNVRVLTPPELSNLGFPQDVIDAGLVVQRRADGTIDVVFNPPKDRDDNVRQQKIEALEDQFRRNGMEEQAARDRATNIVDGNIRIEIVPGLGKAREVNELTGEVKEVPLGQEGERVAAAPERTLFDLAQSGAIAGVAPFAIDVFGRTVGQLPFVDVDVQVAQARQEMVAAQNNLVRALSINPRFPVGEIKRLREEIKIEPAVFDSQRSLIGRMKGIKSFLETRLATEKAAAADPNLPDETRSNAAAAVKDIQNFLDLMGEPPPDEDIPPEGVPDFSRRVGRTRDGNDVWRSPDGKMFVVE